MKHLLLRFLRLMIGLVFFATGMCMTIQANLGRAPWDVLHHGISLVTGLTIGQGNIMMSVVVLTIGLLMKERIGVGTLCNAFLVGNFLDMVMASGLVPLMHGFIPGFLMLVAGMVVMSFASFFYIGSAFYAGPRDLLMVSLTKKTGKPLGLIRNCIEFVAFLGGLILGGQYGIGTLLYALLLGPIMQFVFRLFHFDVKTIQQDALPDTIRQVRQILAERKAAK